LPHGEKKDFDWWVVKEARDDLKLEVKARCQKNVLRVRLEEARVWVRSSIEHFLETTARWSQIQMFIARDNVILCE